MHLIVTVMLKEIHYVIECLHYKNTCVYVCVCGYMSLLPYVDTFCFSIFLVRTFWSCESRFGKTRFQA